jgi:hypothetical protein
MALVPLDSEQEEEGAQPQLGCDVRYENLISKTFQLVDFD